LQKGYVGAAEPRGRSLPSITGGKVPDESITLEFIRTQQRRILIEMSLIRD
jgi:hypothetical protein